MDNILDFITSTKNLLTDSLELFHKLESDMTSDNLNLTVKEEKINQAKLKISQIESVLSHFPDMSTILNNKDKDVAEEKINSLIISNKDTEKFVRSIIDGIIEKVVETDSVVEILDDSVEDMDIIQDNENLLINIGSYDRTSTDSLNIFDILTQESDMEGIDIRDVRIMMTNMSPNVDIKDSVVENESSSKNSTNLSESIEMTEQVNADDLLVLNHAAKEAILKDSDTESVIGSENFNQTNSLIKECSVVLYDISKLNPDINFNELRDFQNLESEINRLCQIPNCSKSKKVLKRNAPKLNRKSQLNSSKLSCIYQSGSEEGSSLSEDLPNSDFDIKISYMDEPPLSSTDSDSSVQMEKIDNVTVSNGKSKKSENMKNRIKNSTKLTVPKISDSDSGNNDVKFKHDSDSSMSTRNMTSGGKRKAVYCSSSSEKDSESDASVSDLYKKVSPKKKSFTKSRSEKSKSNKNPKNLKLETKTGKVTETKAETIKEENDVEEVETRKNIHKIITNAKLSKATKTAEQLEIERRKRIAERQKEYNKDETDEVELIMVSNTSLILEKDQDDVPIVEVEKSILSYLKPHQVEAVKFLWECVIENIDCLRKSQESNSDEDKQTSAVGGCVLAHCMGLGKTLSLIAFMHTMLTTPILGFRTCLVICPVNTALNWKKEWEMWIPKSNRINVFEVCSTECKKTKVQVVHDWSNRGGVLIIGYEMYRLLATGDNRTVRRKIVKQRLSELLVNPGPDFVVCDEGHLLKNNKSAINKAITKINTRRRIVLTGTPLQNKLLEYHTMVQFVKPNLLGTQKEFLNRFVNPINNGQHINSTPYDVNLMKKRSHILFKTLDGCVHRRDYSALVKYLPPKHEYVIKIRLSDIQAQLYRMYLDMCRENRHRLFQDHLTFSRIWTHPFVICMHQEIMDKKLFFVDSDEDEDNSFINDDSDEDSKDTDEKITGKSSPNPEDIINLISDDSESDGVSKKKSKIQDKKDKSDSDSDSSVDEVVRSWSTSTRCAKRNELVDSDDEPVINGIKELKDISVTDKHWWSNIIKPEHEHQIEISGKLAVLFQILRKSSDIGDKIIIFSQSLLVLDIIEKYLHELHTIAEKVQEDLKKLNESIESSSPANEDAQKTNAFLSDVGYNSWIRGLDYDRMDGSTQAFVRADIQSRFNSFEDQRLRLFLISTRAGGMGVNLVAANRVIIFDVSWNPSNDIQAIFRSYRFGQIKPVYVYRLVSQGTMEEKIYERQVTKQSLSLRVVDEQQISRYFTEEDLRSLYKFEHDIYDPNKVRETPILPKDRFLAELIQELPQFIHGYHEHDSLLQNKTEEELTESERQDAWKEFEEEKIRGSRPFPMNQNQPRPMQDANTIYHYQISMMMQQYPQYAALYAQNYNSLVKYVLSHKPDLNSIQLNNEVQQVFLQSLQKYYTYTLNDIQQSDAKAGTSQTML